VSLRFVQRSDSKRQLPYAVEMTLNALWNLDR